MEKYIIFNSRDALFRISLSRIIYFEADRNYTNLYLGNGQKLVFTFGLSDMKEYLEKNMKEDVKNFARIGRSFIANLSYLYKIDLLKQVLLLYDASTNKVFELSVSKGALKDLKELYVKTNNEHGKQE